MPRTGYNNDAMCRCGMCQHGPDGFMWVSRRYIPGHIERYGPGQQGDLQHGEAAIDPGAGSGTGGNEVGVPGRNGGADVSGDAPGPSGVDDGLDTSGVGQVDEPLWNAGDELWNEESGSDGGEFWDDMGGALDGQGFEDHDEDGLGEEQEVQVRDIDLTIEEEAELFAPDHQEDWQPVDDIAVNMFRFVHHELRASHRLAYTSAAASTINGATHNVVGGYLEAAAAAAQVLGDEREMDDPMTTNPDTALKKLGVANDTISVRYMLCDSADCCFALDLSKISDPIASEPHLLPDGIGCRLPLFVIKNGQRIPKRVMPVTFPSTVLQIFFQDADFIDALQKWREGRPDDEVGDKLPSSAHVVGPTEPMTSIFDGTAWRSRDSAAGREVTEEEVRDTLSGRSRRYVSEEFGLLGACNVDWMTTKDVRNAPVGALYITILNLPREDFLKKKWTILALVIPGPGEPRKAAMNRILKPLVNDLKKLEKGVMMRVHGRAEPQLVRFQLLFSSSDIPASRKLSGTLSHSPSTKRPCNHCHVHRDDLKTAAGFDSRNIIMKDPKVQLNAAAKHRVGTRYTRDRIEKNDYVRWSELCRLAGFEHSNLCPPDSMHCMALGLTQSLVVWIVNSGLLDEPLSRRPAGNEKPARSPLHGRPIDDWRYRYFEEALNAFTWPSHIGRLAQNVVSMAAAPKGDGAAKVKADEWNRVRMALPFALWVAFAVSTAETDDISAGHDDVTRKRRRVYAAVVEFVAAIRTLLARSITVAAAYAAQDQLSQATQELVKVGMPLTINWHLAQHFAPFIEKYGPVGGWSTWAYERDNGTLARTRLFKGDLAKLAVSLMNRWNRELLLRAVLTNPAPDATDAEKAFNRRALTRMDTKVVQGTFLVNEYRSRRSNLQIMLPTKPISTHVSLLDLGAEVYASVVFYLRQVCPHMPIRDERAIGAVGEPVPTRDHVSYRFVRFNGFKFAAKHIPKARDRWALALDRQGTVRVCRVVHILQLQLGPAFDHLEETARTVALVQIPATSLVVMPWSMRATALGASTVQQVSDDHELTLIPVTALQSPLAVARYITREGPIMLALNFDKESTDLEQGDLDLDIDEVDGEIAEV